MILQITVKPNARQARLEQLDDGTWCAHVTSPPVDGRANAELLALVAEHFRVPKSAVLLQHGVRSRHKLVRLVAGSEPKAKNAVRR